MSCGAEVQAIRLGPGCAILALPGEFFVETARADPGGGSGLPHLLIACYANHHVMYVVPRHEFERGGYEPGVAMLDETRGSVPCGSPRCCYVKLRVTP